MDAKETHYPTLFSKPVVEDDDHHHELMCLAMARSGTALGAGFNDPMPESSQMILAGTGHKRLMHNSTMLSPQPPPPVALSLRTRETASMALKHIFDAAAAAAAAARDKSTQIDMTGGFHQGMRNQSMPDLRKRVLPELDLTFKKDVNAAAMMAPPAPGAFGSPITTPTPSTQSLLSATSTPHQHVPSEGQIVQPKTEASSSAWASPSNRQSTAQMTIFYSGNVNVYDDVPADKAHAIMILAGNSWPSSSRCPAPPPALTPAAETAALVQVLPPPPLGAAPNVSTTISSVGSSLRSLVAPPTSTTATLSPSVTPPPSPVPSSLADNIMTSSHLGGTIKRPPAGIAELPHARKASLARFLEKRKDRVQVQQVNAEQQAEDEEKGESGAKSNAGKKLHDTLPPPYASHTPSPGKKPCTRSRSPSPSRSTRNVANASDYDEDDSAPNRQLMNEHYFFK